VHLQVYCRTCVTLAFVLLAAPAGAQAARSTSAVPVDSLRSLLAAQFGSPAVINVNVGRRVSLTYRDTAWFGADREVAFNRAFDAAHVVWTRYAARTGVDTVSVAIVQPASLPRDTVTRVEYFFHAAQLNARSRPRLGAKP